MLILLHRKRLQDTQIRNDQLALFVIQEFCLLLVSVPRQFSTLLTLNLARGLVFTFVSLPANARS